jgi:uncharacterized protein
MIIDVHTHIKDEGKCDSYFNKSEGRIKKAIVLAWYKDSLDDLLEFTGTRKDLFPVATVDMKNGIKAQLDKLENLFKNKAIYGIKLYPGYQYFYPSDREAYPVAELCVKYGKPLIFHSGDLYSEDNYNSNGTTMLKYSHPMHIDELAVRFPECRIIISHFGFPYMLETAEIAYKNKNVFTDISGTIEDSANLKNASDLLEQYIVDLRRVYAYYPDVKMKTMFGTDYCGENEPLNQVIPYIKLVERLFNEEERGNVFCDLAEKLFFTENGSR